MSWHPRERYCAIDGKRERVELLMESPIEDLIEEVNTLLEELENEDLLEAEISAQTILSGIRYQIKRFTT